jgi:hypothetical protein
MLLLLLVMLLLLLLLLLPGPASQGWRLISDHVMRSAGSVVNSRLTKSLPSALMWAGSGGYTPLQYSHAVTGGQHHAFVSHPATPIGCNMHRGKYMQQCKVELPFVLQQPHCPAAVSPASHSSLEV